MSRITNPETESSVSCGFFNSSSDSKRAYNAEDLSKIFDGLINDGVYEHVTKKFEAIANSSNTVTISPGRAWFNRTWTENDANLPVKMDEPESVLDRIDAIIIEVDTSEAVRDNFIKVIKGTPASEPKRPTLEHADTLNQYALCYIYRKAGSAKIEQSDITNVVGTSETPFVTGKVETIDPDILFSDWDVKLEEWFLNLKHTLDDNEATKLEAKLADATKAAEDSVNKAISTSLPFEMSIIDELPHWREKGSTEWKSFNGGGTLVAEFLRGRGTLIVPFTNSEYCELTKDSKGNIINTGIKKSFTFVKDAKIKIFTNVASTNNSTTAKIKVTHNETVVYESKVIKGITAVEYNQLELDVKTNDVLVFDFIASNVAYCHGGATIIA